MLIILCIVIANSETVYDVSSNQHTTFYY